MSLPWELKFAMWGIAVLLLVLAALYAASEAYRGGFDTYCETTLHYVGKVPVVKWIFGVPIATTCLIVKAGKH